MKRPKDCIQPIPITDTAMFSPAYDFAVYTAKELSRAGQCKAGQKRGSKQDYKLWKWLAEVV